MLSKAKSLTTKSKMPESSGREPFRPSEVRRTLLGRVAGRLADGVIGAEVQVQAVSLDDELATLTGMPQRNDPNALKRLSDFIQAVSPLRR
jgi:hypothetical protein